MKFIITIIILYTINVEASELSAMKNACSQFVSEACYELGKIYSGEDGLIAHPEKSREYYKKACDLGHDKACLSLDPVRISGTTRL